MKIGALNWGCVKIKNSYMIHSMTKRLTILDSQLIYYPDFISSLQAVEHFSLGKYGDNLDYYGHIKPWYS